MLLTSINDDSSIEDLTKVNEMERMVMAGTGHVSYNG